MSAEILNDFKLLIIGSLFLNILYITTNKIKSVDLSLLILCISHPLKVFLDPRYAVP